MKNKITLPAIGIALFMFCVQAAQACEGCKSSMSEGTAASDAGSGFAASIYFLFAALTCLIGGLVFMVCKAVRQLELARRAEEEMHSAAE